ncbi:hypothetical protein F5Y14DRAFT_419511 [Nemania sp. NC0429]|nr:hypothetical protein F5Y14DRAFT_419511 [Nemania sp. NC0429]
METSPKTRPWTVKRVIHELIAVWFGSVHITSTTACFALLSLFTPGIYSTPTRRDLQDNMGSFRQVRGEAFPPGG